MIRPPQSPGLREPAGCSEVKMMGLSAVPVAWILPPRSMISAALVSLSPKMTVPAGMVIDDPSVM
ncbi:MAG: hypothetical protein ACLTZY_07250 [Alistipes indistinctus]